LIEDKNKNYKIEYSFFDPIRSNNKFFGNWLNKDWSITLFKSYCNVQEYNNVEISDWKIKSLSNPSIEELFKINYLALEINFIFGLVCLKILLISHIVRLSQQRKQNITDSSSWHK